jgi:hypothetical protein
MAVLIILGIVALTPLAAWLAYLDFCRWLVSRTNKAEDLRYAAAAARAFGEAHPGQPGQRLATPRPRIGLGAPAEDDIFAS